SAWSQISRLLSPARSDAYATYLPSAEIDGFITNRPSKVSCVRVGRGATAFGFISSHVTQAAAPIIANPAATRSDSLNPRLLFVALREGCCDRFSNSI